MRFCVPVRWPKVPPAAVRPAKSSEWRPNAKRPRGSLVESSVIRRCSQKPSSNFRNKSITTRVGGSIVWPLRASSTDSG